jgi:hypothetical protein
MKPLDLIEFFDKGAGKFAFIATYDLDPEFFERRILAKKTFGSAERIVVFMDRGRYQELINRGLSASGFNRRYLVVAMDRAPEVFHPKLYLSLGDKRADGLAGSNNCTPGGIAFNMELCSTFSLRPDVQGTEDQIARSVLRQIYDAMKEFAADAGGLKDVLNTQFFRPVEDHFPWLHRDVIIPKGEVELVHSHSTPLWNEVVKRLAKRSVRKVTVLSPFYDKELGFLKQLRKQWPAAALTVVAQQNYATLAGPKLAKLFGLGKKNRLLAANPKVGRRLHAKAFAFETDGGTYWFTGSPNATLAAFDGRNTESALWLRSQERADAVFEDAGLRLKQINPTDFEAGTEQEPGNGGARDWELYLGSAVLSGEGALNCEAEIPVSIKGLTLRVRNYNESLAVLSIPVRGESCSTISLELDENQMAQLRGAAVCELKGTNPAGADVVSNPVALVQLYHLLKERTPGQGTRSALQTISETGENLVPYIDSLGSVREAVEFFGHCSIKFFDGESGSPGGRGELWKPRNPFKPDTPPEWLNIPAGGAAKDLQIAIWDFVERHQWEKLYKHVRRGNLNGLPNFLDIFRTLNGLLLTYHSRVMEGAPVVNFGFVTNGIMSNLELLIGPFEPREDGFEGNGFISAIYANVQGDRKIVRERLGEERVPQMLRAAVEAMIAARMTARRMPTLDAWAMLRLRWVAEWIKQQGFEAPSADEVRAAGMEYLPIPLAA